MRHSFTQCAGVIVLSMMVSGCYSGGKWTMPWQSSSPFSSSTTPSSSNVAGATKPSALANTAPPKDVAAPQVAYPTYQGTAAGMNASNNLAPTYQPTNPPAGSSLPTYTASSNNAASRSGAMVAPQQGSYPTNNGSYPANTVSTGVPATSTSPYNNAAVPSNTYNGNSAGYGNYAAPSSGSGAAQPTTPYNGAQYQPSGTQPIASNYPRSASNAGSIPTNPTISPAGANPPAGPLTGSYDAGGWSSSPGNPARSANQPVGGDRYSSSNDRYGSNTGDNYASTGATPPASSTSDTRYGNTPIASTPDSRSGSTQGASTPDPRYGILPTASTSDSRYSNLPTTSTPDARYAPVKDNSNINSDSYGSGATPNGSYTPVGNSGTGSLIPSSGTSSGATKSSGSYQPGSVSAYEPPNMPTVITANSSTGTTSR
jgi:hypothetical protein